MAWKWKRKIKTAGLLVAAAWLVAGGMAGTVLTDGSAVGRTKVLAAEQQISLSASAIILSVGDSYTLSLKGTDGEITWRANRKSVATVSGNGVVKAVSVGTTAVIATTGGKNYRCTVRVEQPRLNTKELSAKIGDTYTLKVLGTKRKAVFKSSDSKVVKVSSKGKMTFLKPGKAKVSVLVGNTTLSCRVTVGTPSVIIPSIMAAGTVKAVDLGWETYSGIRFASSAPDIVSVDGDGILTAKKPGSAKITVKIGNFHTAGELIVPGTAADAVRTGETAGLDAEKARIAGLAHEIYTEVITDGMDMVDKILAIHDYLVLHTEYAYQEYLAGTLDQIPYVFSPEGVLVRHKAVCQGYAETLELFLDALGLENHLVSGYGYTGGGSIRHAWNLVKLDGSWYHIDMTWDDPVISGGDSGKVYYDYFLVDDAKIKKDHSWEEDEYPAADGGVYGDYGMEKEVEKYRAAGQYLETLDGYVEEAAGRAVRGEREITLMFPGHVQPDLNAMLERIAVQIPGRELGAEYKYFFYGDYTVSTTYITVR